MASNVQLVVGGNGKNHAMLNITGFESTQDKVMNLKAHPSEVAVALLRRSACHVQVAAVLADKYGIFAWGWNSSGSSGYGQHAEAHCMSRANRHRLKGATMWVAARRRRNGKTVNAKPCDMCQLQISQVGEVFYRDKDSEWRAL